MRTLSSASRRARRRTAAPMTRAGGATGCALTLVRRRPRLCARDTTRSCAPDLRGACASLEPEELTRACRVEAARGWPFGIDVSPFELAVEARQLGDQLGELADRDLGAGAEVDRIGAVVAIGGKCQPLHAVLDVEELAGGRAVPPEHDPVAAVDHLPDQIRDDVRCLQVEVVARAVEVRGQQEDRVEAVLLAVRLRSDEDRLLRDAVRCNRLLR